MEGGGRGARGDGGGLGGGRFVGVSGCLLTNKIDE